MKNNSLNASIALFYLNIVYLSLGVNIQLTKEKIDFYLVTIIYYIIWYLNSYITEKTHI